MKKINKHNYEEYFLLYADNELSEAERAEVYRFVSSHPELEEEFLSIQSTVLQPEKDVHMDKTSLKRSPGTFIHSGNYEEVLLSYIDGELDPHQEDLAKEFVLHNPKASRELTILHKVKLNPDLHIGFGDKRSLYRNAKNGRIIPIWWRSVAAAVIAGILLWGGYTYLHKPALNDLAMVKPKPVKKEVVTPVITSQPATVTARSSVIGQDNVQQAVTARVKDQVKPGNRQSIAKPSRIKGNSTPENKINSSSSNDIAINTPVEDLPVPALTGSGIPDKVQIKRPASGDLVKTVAMNNIDYPVVKVIPAAYIEQPEESNDNYIFYNIREDKFKKSKVGIFLKKVGRTIERSAHINPAKNFKTAEVKLIP